MKKSPYFRGESSNANRSLTFYAEFENKKGKMVWLDIKEDEIARHTITLF